MDKLSEVEDNLKDYLNNNADIQKIKGSPRQYFGLGTMIAAFFLLGLNLVFPPEDRAFWSACCFLILAIGAWQLDVAKKEGSGKRQ